LEIRPLGRELVTTETGVVTVMLVETVAVCTVGELLSVTLTLNTYGPLVVGVPEMRPEEERVRPGGNVPDALLQVYGVVPPVAVSEVE
jgi:hypothetical protein